jgi:hypothetical protein
LQKFHIFLRLNIRIKDYFLLTSQAIKRRSSWDAANTGGYDHRNTTSDLPRTDTDMVSDVVCRLKTFFYTGLDDAARRAPLAEAGEARLYLLWSRLIAWVS